MRALTLRTATRQTRRGNAGSDARTLRPNSDSRGPTLVEGTRGDQVDVLVTKIQTTRVPVAVASADEQRPCSHTRCSQSQCAAWHQS
jgi:hypothetical protein